MNITDELRDWFEHGFRYERCGDDEGGFKRVYSPWFGWKSCIEQMLDRIDAAVDGTVELPKDADGVPIRVGDKLRFDNGMIVEVRYLKIDSEGTSVCVLATNGGGDFYAITDKARHYHEPTIEDVLREFAQECLTYATNVDDHEVVDAIEKYAKRLTLAGDAE